MERPVEARWIGAERPTHRVAEQMPGLLGYELMCEFWVFLDYPAKRLAVSKPDERREAVDIHRWYIDRGEARTNDLERVRALFVLGQTDAGRQRLERIADRRKVNPAAIAMLARLERREGQADQAAKRIQRLSVRDLIDTGEIISSVNSMWLSGRIDAAVEQATTATILQPESSLAWLSLSDAFLAAGETGRARRAMQTVIELEANPAAHLLRRSVIAIIDQDKDGALSHLRDHLRNRPTDGYGYWLYAQVAQGAERRAMASADLAAAARALSEPQQPMDFMAAAWQILGDPEQSGQFYEAGLRRDCGRALNEASQNNCEAWYQAMLGQDLGEAEVKINSALSSSPGRAEFLDTLAVVLHARGNAQGARDASWAAARHSPDDVYLFTQALRFQAALSTD